MQRTRGRLGRAAGAARASPGSGSSATVDNRDGVRDEFGSPPPPRRQRAEGDLDTRVAQDAAAAAAATMGAKAAADSGRSSWRTTVGFCVAAGALAMVTGVTTQKDNEASWRRERHVVAAAQYDARAPAEEMRRTEGDCREGARGQQPGGTGRRGWATTRV